MGLLKIIILCIALPLLMVGGYKKIQKHRLGVQKFLKKETMVYYLDQKKLHSKLKNPPAWMKEQIFEDFTGFSTQGISKKQVDATFAQIKKNYPHPYYVRYRVINNQLYRYFPEGEPISLIDNANEKAIKTLIYLTGLKDVDLILSYEDGVPLSTMPDGFYLMDKKELQAPLLVSAKLKGTPHIVLIPDWRSVSEWWAADIKNILSAMKNSNWEQKKEKAIWRGGLTRQARLKFCEVAVQYPELLNAKLNDLNIRAQLEEKGLFGERISWEEFLGYKYLPILDGVMCAAPALQWRLLSNSVTLKQESDEIQWFYRAIQPFVHYLPLKNDLSDVVEQIEWAKSHDSACQEIVKNSTDFVLNNLMMEDVYLYFYHVLDQYASLQNLHPKELKKEIESDPRWVNIQSRNQLRKDAALKKMEGFVNAATPF